MCAGLTQLVDYGFQYGRVGVAQTHITTGRRSGSQKSTAFNAIGHHLMTGGMQARHTRDAYGIGAGATDLRPHRDQAIGQIDHFRLPRRVANDRFAIGQGRRHHDVFGACHRDHVGDDVCAFQARRARQHITMLDSNRRAHRLKRLDVLIDRAHADRAPTGQRNAGLTATRQQRSQHQHRGTHGLDQLIRCKRIIQAAGIQLDAEFFVDRNPHAHLCQQRQHRRHVVQMRHVRNTQRFGAEDGRAQYRQSGVFCAGDTHLALERDAALDDQLVHACLSVLIRAYT